MTLLCPPACGDAGAGETGDSTPATTSGSTGDTSGTTGDAPTSTTGDTTSITPTGTDTGDAGWTPSTCYDGWDELLDRYPDAGALQDCAGVPGGLAVQRSLLVVDGITIDNNGEAMQPCVEARCDASYAYIASNDLPHYDYVQTNPNPLMEAPGIVRIALAPALPAGDVTADPATIQNGCGDAYAQYLDDPGQATAAEPSGLCSAGQGGLLEYLRETLESGETATYAKILCLGGIGVIVNGVTANGPNEAQTPDPYGNPVFGMPEVAGDFDQTAFLDLCGGHSGGSMHYHGLNEACFEQAADGTPASSYATASQGWDLAKMLTGACTEPSGIIGWSLDGYPIQGPCVCTARAGDACTQVKRVRSAWVHDGLGGWGEDPGEGAALGVEGTICDDDNICCPGGGAGCDFRCAPVIVDSDDPDGSAVEKRCALLDYAWCTHRYVDRSLHAGGDFVYLDRCNGYEGPDGYAYHATASFPYIQGCYRGVPNLAPMGGMMMGDDDGGMEPPKCMQGQTMCCGDATCDGPETADNCPEDC
ncbi:MAG TPA: YHYH protein [Nannocystis sp.]